MSDKNLVAYCRLCGDSFNHKGRIADLSKDLRKELRQAKFDQVSQGLSNFSKHLKTTNNATKSWEPLSDLDAKSLAEAEADHHSAE